MVFMVAPVSSVRKQEYEAKVDALRQKQMDAFEKRVVSNTAHAETMTVKILENIKAQKAAEAEKMRNADSFYVPAEPNFIVAIQIRSKCNVGPAPRKVMELMRMTSINTCVILRNNKSTKNMLAKAKDYIAFGFIDYELLRRLVYERGFGKIGHSKVKLTNENIEEHFAGKYRCIEELVYAIYSGSDDIKQILNFLYPLKLSVPLGGFKGKKSKNYLEGGACNNHKELLGKLLERMI
ncbi:large subunit ribosomal protein L7e [Pancytospora philotis]|nr:large subunit ribosomal protein L7e [Pancytospora philotis]